jgi:hypothetical protein
MRKVTFIDSKSQSQKVINNSTATTLGELKAEMRAAGIDYTDMSFYEGHIRAELLDDNSILPTDIPYKGQVVNDLVFMLSTTNKKIKSGVDRIEVYGLIKGMNLQDEVKRIFNRNYTQVPTDDLLKLISRHTPANANKKVKTMSMEAPNICTEKFSRIKQALINIIDILYDESIIGEDDYNDMLDMLDYEGLNNAEDQKMTPQEIGEMFNFMN